VPGELRRCGSGCAPSQPSSRVQLSGCPGLRSSLVLADRRGKPRALAAGGSSLALQTRGCVAGVSCGVEKLEFCGQGSLCSPSTSCLKDAELSRPGPKPVPLEGASEAPRKAGSRPRMCKGECWWMWTGIQASSGMWTTVVQQAGARHWEEGHTVAAQRNPLQHVMCCL